MKKIIIISSILLVIGLLIWLYLRSDKLKPVSEVNAFNAEPAIWSQEKKDFVCGNGKKVFQVNCIKAPCPGPTCI